MTENERPPGAAAMARARRVVVKIGSALLVPPGAAALDEAWLDALIADVAAWMAAGREVILVSSGAVALGRGVLGQDTDTARLEEKQAAAAAGQIRLARAYESRLAGHGLAAGQILLGIEDTEQRRRHLNARATIATLLDLGAVPVINENDSVATAEIRFGDNDRLAARVAQMMNAEMLVLLSDIDGLYTADPRHDPAARHLPVIDAITSEIRAMAGAPPPGHSSGGMVTKLEAARIATGAGCELIIARGDRPHALAGLTDPATPMTLFRARTPPRRARKQWIAGHLHSAGTVRVDAGAARALAAGRSLLAAGVAAVEGSFERGDAVRVTDPDGTEIARGLVRLDAGELARIAGCKSAEAEALLGAPAPKAVIHRDDLALTGG